MIGADQHAHSTENSLFYSKKPIRALCVHGHFYQPPREDPLTGVIPVESGASPFTNWNERILAECYHPNAELGNFERISFNVGPTLIKWIESYDPITYRRILTQDRSIYEHFGVGIAMAQSYHHTILPLDSRREKVTQVAWGIADFKYRFGRDPQGMWLPETAADTETLEVLAEQGIEFTILAPWQAETPNLDPTEPYWVNLPSGRRIAVFFYQDSLSGGVSFNQTLTSNAHDFVLNNLTQYYKSEKFERNEPQILLVASDGELYGHHQTFRDWFLAYLVNGAGARAGIEWTFPALWLRQNPPKKSITIREKTSWSCYHGVTRWTGDCTCVPGPGEWKFYLRNALDNLAQKVDHLYENALQPFGIDPWKLRDRYIEVLLDQRTLGDLVSEMANIKHPNGKTECIQLLLEAQRERQRMYTSCAFFFEDFDRIEPQNSVAYAAQAVRLVRRALGVDLAPQLVADLQRVTSNRADKSGDQVFARFMERAKIYEGAMQERSCFS